MNDHELRKLFSCLSEEAVERSHSCPRTAELAAWVEGRLGEADAVRVEGHLADCAHCLGQVRFLVRSDAEVIESAPVPLSRPSLIDTLRDRGRRWLSPPRRPALATLALAASLLAAVVVTVQYGVRSAPKGLDTGGGAVDTAQPAQPEREVRTHRPSPGAAGADLPTVLNPRDGSEVARASLVLAWEPVPEALSYSVRLVDAAGALVWQDETETISTTVPPEVELTPGGRYYVWVAANLRSGLRQRAHAVEFRIAGE